MLALQDENTGNAPALPVAWAACTRAGRCRVVEGESAADDALFSTAASLVHSGITATVAMQFAVIWRRWRSRAASTRSMAHSIAVDEAVRLGRIAIDGTGEQTLEWVTRMRIAATRLFELSAADGVAATATSEEGEAIPEEAAKYGLYVQALAAVLRKGRYGRGGGPLRQREDPLTRATGTRPAAGCRSSGPVAGR